MTTTNPTPIVTDDVTADVLAKHWAVCAQRDFLAIQESGMDRNLMARLVYEWASVFLLRVSQERAGTPFADALARDLWETLNDGFGLDQWMRKWLTEYGIDPAAVTPITDTTWPPPWTLKPAHGDPHDSSDAESPESIGWDLSFGFRLNIDHDDYEDVTTPLTIGAQFSDADKERGMVKRQVTPDQLEQFARLLLNVAAAHKQREAGR